LYFLAGSLPIFFMIAPDKTTGADELPLYLDDPNIIAVNNSGSISLFISTSWK
jgi:hypothetical protein